MAANWRHSTVALYPRSMPRFPAGQTLLIDADDTLWENNVYFERAIAESNSSPVSGGRPGALRKISSSSV